jgi:hypothetical protein
VFSLRNDGNAAFEVASTWLTGGSPRAVLASQLDSDASPEIAVADWARGVVTVFESLEDASLSSPDACETQANPKSLAVMRLGSSRQAAVVATNYSAGTLTILPVLSSNSARPVGAMRTEPERDAPVPSWTLSLNSIRPNPVSKSCVIDFTLATRSRATIRLYDIAGRLVRTIFDGELDAGPQRVTWSPNGADLVGPGSYFVQLHCNQRRVSRHVVILR